MSKKNMGWPFYAAVRNDSSTEFQEIYVNGLVPAGGGILVTNSTVINIVFTVYCDYFEINLII